MKAILKVRLSILFLVLVVLFFALLSVIPKVPIAAGALTLFSVNSFLLGFYIAPILSAQKLRIDTINKVTHTEALALYKVVLMARDLPKSAYNHFKEQMAVYIKARI